jgi:hypothetical protein
MKIPITLTEVLLGRRIVVPVAVVALGAAGTGVAMGKSGGGGEPSTDATFEVAPGPGLAMAHAPRPDLLKDQADEFWGNVADHLGVEQSALEDALREAAVDQVEAAKEDGKLTDEQVAEIEKRIREGDLPPGPPIPFLGGPDELAIPPEGGPIAAAADYLGLSDRELFDQLDDGSSLANVAEEQGKSVDGLKQAILDDARKHLDEAVDSGKLDTDQRDEILDGISSHLDEMVNGEFPPVKRIREGDLHRRGGTFAIPLPPPGFGQR